MIISSIDLSDNSLAVLLPALRILGMSCLWCVKKLILKDRIINLSIQSLREDNPNEYVNIENQTCNELSSYYINSAVGSNDGLSVMVTLESTETEAAFYQLVGLLRETSDLLKAEIKDKQAINNSIDTKNVTKNEIKIYEVVNTKQ